MVHLTKALCRTVPDWFHLQRSAGSFFKKQALFHMTRFTGRNAWSQRKSALNRFHYMLKEEWFNAPLIRGRKMDTNRARIAAACEEHDMPYGHFISTLPKIDIHLATNVLARLAIYEPQTFKSLVDIAREAQREPPQPGNFNPRLI